MTTLLCEAPLLPFIPEPFADEILGSWLSRIRLENGAGAWRALLEHAGYGRRLHLALFDMVDYNEKLSSMLTSLGTTYERVVLELSTLPYWIIFSASDGGSRLPGTETIPALRLKNTQVQVNSIANIGTQRVRYKPLEPRYCPKCLSDDFEELGQAFWHKSHQLPNVFYCHKHCCELRVRCAVCGANFIGSNPVILSLPTLKCRCGFRLSQVIDSRIPSAHELRLIDISIRALNYGIPTWNRDNVFSFLRLQLRQNTSSSYGRYQKVLENAFPGNLVRPFINSDTFKEEVRMYFRPYLSSGGAPECCALLAALNVDFETAISGFITSTTDDTKPSSSIGAKDQIMTIERSRLALVQAHKLHPERSIVSVRNHYWYLRLYDPRWLKKNFPKCRQTRTPTIAEDRAKIISIISSVQPSWSKAHHLAHGHPAGIRATFRDQDWFSEQKRRLKKEMAKEKTDFQNSLFTTRRARLSMALNTILSSKERPKRATPSTLAPLAGLSISQVISVLKLAPELCEAIEAANTGKIRRQLLWAARQLRNSGVTLSKIQLSRVAGLNTAVISDTLFLEIVAQC